MGSRQLPRFARCADDCLLPTSHCLDQTCRSDPYSDRATSSFMISVVPA
jgi:hypothetical protein